MPNIQEDLAKILNSRYGKDVRQAIHDSIEDINDVCDEQKSTIEEYTNIAASKASEASNSENTATSKASEASNSADAAANKATEALNSANTATNKASEALNSASLATNKASEANQRANDANTYAVNASASAISASESENGARQWYERAKDAVESMGGGLVPRGNITFEELPSVDESSIGDYYTISNSFVTTSDFVIGEDVNCNPGTKIYLNANYKWEIEPGNEITADDLLLTENEL